MTKQQREKTPKLNLKAETIKDIMQHYSDPKSFGEFFASLKRSVIESALESELDHHLGYRSESRDTNDIRDDNSAIGSNIRNTSNTRNGYSSKTLITDSGTLDISTPRDRDSSFRPRIVEKYQRRLEGFDEKIISMYALGMSMSQIQDHLYEIYGTEVSPELISSVTDKDNGGSGSIAKQSSRCSISYTLS